MPIYYNSSRGSGGSGDPSSFGGQQLGVLTTSGTGILPETTKDNNYYIVSNSAVLPITVDGKTLYNKGDFLIFQGGQWIVKSVIPNTQSTQVQDVAKESLSGEASTQQDINIENRQAIIDLKEKAYILFGIFSSTEPTGNIENGLFWFQTDANKLDGSDLPKVFPINVKVYKNGAWSSTTQEYTPSNQDSWNNRNNNYGYYWFDDGWRVNNAAEAEVDNETIEYNDNSQLEVKDRGIGFKKLNPKDVINSDNDHLYYGFLNNEAEQKQVFTKSITGTVDVYKITKTGDVITKIEVIGQGTIAEGVLSLNDVDYNRDNTTDGVYIEKTSEKLITLNYFKNATPKIDIQKDLISNFYYSFKTDNVEYFTKTIEDGEVDVYVINIEEGNVVSITKQDLKGEIEERVLSYNEVDYNRNQANDGFYVVNWDNKPVGVEAIKTATDDDIDELFEDIETPTNPQKFILTKGLKRFINNLAQNFVLNQDDVVNKNKILQVQSNGAINLSNFDIIKDVDITTAIPEDNTDILYRDVNDGKLYFYKNDSFIQINGDSLIYCTELPTENINSKVIYAKHYNENKNVEYLIYDTVLEKWISIYNDANIFLQPKDIQNEKLNSNNFYYIWSKADERFFCWVASAYEGQPKLFTKTLAEGTDIDTWEIVFNDNGKPTSITKTEQKSTIEKINDTLRLKDAKNRLYDRLVRLDGFYTTEKNTIFTGTYEVKEMSYVQVFKIAYNEDIKKTISIEDYSFNFEIIKENDEFVLQEKTGDGEKFVRQSSLDGYYIAGKSIVGLGMIRPLNETAITDLFKEIPNSGLNIIDMIYPVGSIICNNGTDPSNLYSGTTWEKYITGKKVLYGDDTAGTNIAEELPNITGNVQRAYWGGTLIPSPSGAFVGSTTNNYDWQGKPDESRKGMLTALDFKASNSSSVYKDNGKVRVEGKTVCYWIRTK